MQATQTVTAATVRSQTHPSGSTMLYGGTIKLDFERKTRAYKVTDLSKLTTRDVPSVTQILDVVGGTAQGLTCALPLVFLADVCASRYPADKPFPLL